MKRGVAASLLLWLFCWAEGVARLSGSEGSLPPSLSAAILVRLVALDSSRAGAEDIRIHVLGNEALAKELETHVGHSVGARVLGGVSVGDRLPEGRVDVVVVSNRANLPRVLAYSEKRGAISASTNPDFGRLGVSLVIYDDEGMPGILLNRSASRREGLRWEPEILQVAQLTGE
ncbi:YfiR family protein [Pelagicoccus mobilis]|uniref:YfiR family protein n=1 Tax=Pelagicoccus mobilis TaxID=415221 RepID=A0A934VT07_9BACT|nr:YfiR family protein [Pelagicoccus mobilis]MBK1879575.1 YfiR family protein [Pelagicoccus mobilis]